MKLVMLSVLLKHRDNLHVVLKSQINLFTRKINIL